MYKVFLYPAHILTIGQRLLLKTIRNQQPELCLSSLTAAATHTHIHTLEQALNFTLTNAGRLAWLGLFTIRNLKFLNSTRAGAPGWVLTDLLWLLAVISDLCRYTHEVSTNQKKEQAGGWGAMYWRIWLQGGGIAKREVGITLYAQYFGGTRTVRLHFREQFFLYPQLQILYHTMCIGCR